MSSKDNLNRGNDRSPNSRQRASLNTMIENKGYQVDIEKITNRGRDHEPTGNKPGIKRGQSIQGERGLTAKQDAFALAVAKGSSLSGAYRASYNAEGMADGTVWTEASLLADNPRVASRVAFYVEQIEREKPHDDAATRRMVRDYLVSVVQDNGAKVSDRTKAAELLGKVAGVALFSQREKEATAKPSSHAEFDALFQKLASMVREEVSDIEEEASFLPRTATDLAVEEVESGVETPPAPEPPCAPMSAGPTLHTIPQE